MSKPYGSTLAPVTSEHGANVFVAGAWITPNEAIARYNKWVAEQAAQAKFNRSWRGRLAIFRRRFERAWAAFKDEDTGL
jgi:hypothetical protein